MAPELVRGERYTEKVDVFSYGMCLVELVDRNLPWHGSGVGQQGIPFQLAEGKRPEHQLRAAPDPRIKELIIACWQGQPDQRPDFVDIVARVASNSAEAESRPSSPPRRTVGGAE